MTIPKGCALSLDYVPVIDWSDILKSQTRSIKARDTREEGVKSENRIRRNAANGTITGMGHCDPERAKRICKPSKLGVDIEAKGGA